nr:DUF1631 family protein [Endozoicomonas montiporae]
MKQNHSDVQWFHRVNIMDMLLWNLQEGHQQSLSHDDWLLLKNHLLELLNEIEFNPFDVAEWFHTINAMTSRQLDLEEEEIIIQKGVEQNPSQYQFNVDNNWEPEFEDTEYEMPVVGQWVEFIGKNDHRLRCKLATINLRTDRYVFVNKSGMKVADWSGSELGRAISNQRVELQDNHQFFDRALQAVMGNFLKF